MSPKFTKHGKIRSVECAISPEEIDAVLASDDTLTVPSLKDESASLAMGKAQGKLWVVVFNKETGNVVTVRRASKTERRFYEEEQEN